MAKKENRGENPKKGKDKDDGARGLVRRVNIEGILPPGFKTTVFGAVKKQEQQEVWQDRGKWTEVTARKVMDAAENRALQIRRTSQAEVGARLLKGISEVGLTVAGTDPFEEFRKAQGLDTEREQLINFLFKELTVENGLNALRATEARLGFPLSGSETDALSRYCRQDPKGRELNVTKTELLLFGLCEAIPPMFLQGEVFRVKEVNDKGVLVDQLVSQPSVPFIAGATIDGFTCAPDQVNLNDRYVEDMYEAIAGITGANGSAILARFRPEVKAAIEKLIPLMVTNARLFERLWEEKARDGNAYVDGFKRVQRAAAERIIAPLVTEAEMEQIRLDPLAQVIDSIARLGKTDDYQALCKQYEESIIASTTVDLTGNGMFETQDTIRIFGLLSRIPDMYLDPQHPFEGYIMPYGAGIVFMDERGAVQDYVYFNNYYLREFLNGVHFESVDISKSNKTLVQLFNMLGQQARGKAPMEGELSELEGIVIEAASLRFGNQIGIELDIFPRVSLPRPQNWAEAGSLESEHFVAEPAYKLGLREAQDAINTIKVLPPAMVEGVKRIKKLTHPATTPIQDLLTGQHTIAEIDKLTNVITVFQHPEQSYLEYGPEMRELRAFTLTHEIGHNVWSKLSREDRIAWRNISWVDGMAMEEDDDYQPYFLTMYGHSVNPEEDFCDHFAAFVRHGDEFRQKATTSEWLSQKYQMMGRVFEQFAGRHLEYRQQSLFSLENLMGYVNGEIKRLSDLTALETRTRIEERRDRRIAAHAQEVFRTVDKVEDPVEEIIEKLHLQEEMVELDHTFRTIQELTEIFSAVADEAGEDIEAGLAEERAGLLYQALIQDNKKHVLREEKRVRAVMEEESDELKDLRKIILDELKLRKFDYKALEKAWKKAN